MVFIFEYTRFLFIEKLFSFTFANMNLFKFQEVLDEPILFFVVLFLSNLLMLILNVCLSYIWNNYFKLNSLEYNLKDVFSAVFVAIGINVLVAIPGYFLYINSFISFTNVNFFLDFLLIFFSIDVLMYFFHLLSHYVMPFKKMHQNHHQHKTFNGVSLYVMHPFEAVAFGLLLTVVVIVFSVNIYSFLIFLFINWLYGVIGHLNTKSTKNPKLFGNNVFHQNHHKYGKYNFGFYTVLWDKLFGTYFTNGNIG